MKDILDFISNEIKIDFSQYKESTISRRLKKRMADSGIKSTKDYLKKLKGDEAELEELITSILIGVTRFYRDKAAFSQLEEKLETQLTYLKEDEFRAWVVGCATGEEAYTAAILLSELFQKLNKTPQFRVFASDMNPQSVKFARLGTYPAEKIKAIPKTLVAKYFKKNTDGSYTATTELKRHIVFSVHNILHDPPFININFISCRNLFIYFKREIQDTVFAKFKNSLVLNGTLFLGKTESLGVEQRDFHLISSKAKIYQLIDKSRKTKSIKTLLREQGQLKEQEDSKTQINYSIREEIGSSFSHPYILIDDNYNIVEKSGDTSLFLDLQDDVSNLNVAQMLNKTLRQFFYHLINEIKETGSSSRSQLIEFKRFDKTHYIVLELIPIFPFDDSTAFFIVVFETINVGQLSTAPVGQFSESEHVIRLEEQILIQKEQIKSYQQNYELIVQETQNLTNDLQSTNEELKSTNEELETSNEELQTTNEELFEANLELNTRHMQLVDKEKELNESQKLFKLLADNTQDIVSLHGSEGQYLYISPSAEEVTSYKVEELYKLHPFDVMHKDDLPAIQQSLEQVLKTGETQYSIYRYKYKSGNYEWMETFTKLVRDSKGEIQGILNTSRNIQKRIEAQLELKKERRYLNEILESPTNLVVFSLDKGYNYKAFNSNHKNIMKAIWGIDIEVGTNMLECISDTEDRAKAKSNFDRVLRGEEFTLIEEYGDSDLQRTFYENFYSPTKNEHGAVDGVTVFVTDISNIKESERKTLEEKERLLVTLRSIGDGVVTTDIDGTIDLMNEVAEKILEKNKAEFLGKSFDNVFVFEDLETREPVTDFYQISSSLMMNEHVMKRLWVRLDENRKKLISLRLSPIYDSRSAVFGAVIVFHDITDQEKTQFELQKAQKLESLGVLAGGIAHDFNNFLTGMLGHISLMKVLEPHEKDDMAHSLDAIERASKRAQKLTKQLLTFSKGGNPIKETTLVEQHIKDAVEFSLRGSNVSSSFNFDKSRLQVDLDIGQFEQVIQNLAINAKQAMDKGGTITVRTESITISAKQKPQLKAGMYLKIEFSDTGAGIAKDELKNVFDPFFTTKAEGSGLGLATSYSIIQKHDGHIEASSVEGSGTTFTIYLPRSVHQVEEVAATPQEIHEGKGVVLILDDETMIQDVMKKMLNKVGYDVLVTETGDETVKMLKQLNAQNKDIAFAMLDVTIPGGRGGLDIYPELRQIDPDLKVVITSGYSNDEILSQSSEHQFDAFLPKPFTFQDFNQTIKKILR